MELLAACFLFLAAASGVVYVVLAARRRQKPTLPSGHQTNTDIAVGYPSVAPDHKTLDLGPTELILGDPSSPLLKVTAAPVRAPGVSRTPVTLPSSVIEQLSSVLQHAPGILVHGAALGSSLMKMTMTFSPQTTAGLASGALKLSSSANGAVRAIARDTITGRFIEHARIVTNVNPAVAVAVVWQVNALITAQKYLADIKASLQKIEKGVAEIRELIEGAVAGQLQGNLDYLRDRIETLHTGDISSTELHAFAAQIEEIDRTTRGVTSQLLRQLTRQSEAIKNASWGKILFGADDKVAEAQAQIADSERTAQRLLLSVQVRLLGTSVRTALGLHDTYAERTLESLQRDLDEGRGAWERLASETHRKTLDIGATFQREATDEKQRTAVRVALESATASIRDEFVGAVGIVNQLSSSIKEDRILRSLPLEVEVEVDQHGNIVSAERLLPASQ